MHTAAAKMCVIVSKTQTILFHHLLLLLLLFCFFVVFFEKNKTNTHTHTHTHTHTYTNNHINHSRVIVPFARCPVDIRAHILHIGCLCQCPSFPFVSKTGAAQRAFLVILSPFGDAFFTIRVQTRQRYIWFLVHANDAYVFVIGVTLEGKVL